MPTLRCNVNAATHAAFHGYARGCVMSDAELLRAVVLLTLGQPVTQLPFALPDGAATSLVNVTVKMPGFISAAIERRADAQDGMSKSRYISNLAQSHVMHDPVMSVAAIDALRAGNRELAALGRLLNQVARMLNSGINDNDLLRVTLLESLVASIREQQARIAQLVHASQQDWHVCQSQGA